MGDGAGLAGAGTGEHPDGTSQGGGDLTLLRVERTEQIVRMHSEMFSVPVVLCL